MAYNTSDLLLGSGKLYITEFSGEIPEDSEFETAANMLGRISGGATLTYKPTFYEAKDDMCAVRESFLTEEEVTLKSGVCTFNGEALSKISATARVTDTAGKRTLKIGGIGNDNKKKYAIRFVHEDEEKGDIRVTVVGKNENGFSLAFAKDKETVVDLEFKASPSDTNGTLVIYEEEIVA